MQSPCFINCGQISAESHGPANNIASPGVKRLLWVLYTPVWHMTVVVIDGFWCLISIYPNCHSEIYAFFIQSPCDFSEADPLRNSRVTYDLGLHQALSSLVLARVTGSGMGTWPNSGQWKVSPGFLFELNGEKLSLCALCTPGRNVFSELQQLYCHYGWGESAREWRGGAESLGERNQVPVTSSGCHHWPQPKQNLLSGFLIYISK